jgi:hypothetical protein
MSGQEFTQTFQIPIVAAGLSAVDYFELQGTGTYIIKALSYYADVDLEASVGGSVVQLRESATSGTGTNTFFLYTESPTLAPVANQVTQLISDSTQQLITQQNCLGMAARVLTAGNLFFTVSYIYIPTASTWINNFLRVASQLAAPSTQTFNGPTSGNAYIIKSIYVTPVSAAAGSLTLSFGNGTTTSLLDTPVVIAAGTSYVYSVPIYLQTGYFIQIKNNGASSLNINISYAQEPS